MESIYSNGIAEQIQNLSHNVSYIYAVIDWVLGPSS